MERRKRRERIGGEIKAEALGGFVFVRADKRVSASHFSFSGTKK